MEYDSYFDICPEEGRNKVFVLIIYDIVDDRVRTRFAKCLQGYGFRVQKSAFEAIITQQKYKKLLLEIPRYVTGQDSVRLYKIQGKGQVLTFGETKVLADEDIILI